MKKERNCAAMLRRNAEMTERRNDRQTNEMIE